LLTSLKDNEGKIIAYCEWRLVGKSGFDQVRGEYVWVEDLWVHGDYKMTNRINRMIDEILRLVPSAKYCYFKRGKYKDRLKMFKREQWERRRRTFDPLITPEDK